MASLNADEQIEAITDKGITGLGMSRATVEAMIAKCDGDRLALNALRVKLNTKHRTLCGQINRTADNAILDQYAAAADARHAQTLEDGARKRRQDRQRMTPGQRVDRVLTELNAMSTVPAVTMPDPNLRGVTVPKYAEWQDPGVGRHDRVDVGPLVNAITVLAEHLEAVLDAQRGLVPPHELATLPTEVKDRWILGLRGVHSKVVASSMPWLGHHKTIERVRREAGQRPVDGTEPRERASAA